MGALSVTVAAIGCLFASAGFAQTSPTAPLTWGVPIAPGMEGTSRAESEADLSLLVLRPDDIGRYPYEVSSVNGAPAMPVSRSGRFGSRYFDYAASNPAAWTDGLTVGIKLQSLSTAAAAISLIQQQSGIDTRALLTIDHWLSMRPGLSQSFSLGHAWRELRLEGTVFSNREDEPLPGRGELPKIDSRSARLSFSPATNWLVRMSRGTVSGLDHLVAGGEVRRTAISATYRRSFADGDWEATFAWGRNSRKSKESIIGYLVESAYRFDGVRTLFGRLEQVGSDELAREDESLRRSLFKMNRLTVGYSQEFQVTTSLKLDAGAYVSRYFVPSGMEPSYGSDPITYMMFVRVSLQ